MLYQMRIPILNSLWTSYLASQLPCHPMHTTWSREHVIPTSIIPNRIVTQNPYNLIPLPKRLNNGRGNRPYTNTTNNSEFYVVRACDSCPTPGWCPGAACVGDRGVIPSEIFRGPIARSVLRSVGKYPALYDAINSKVLNIDIAIQWNSKYPASVQERNWFDSLS